MPIKEKGQNATQIANKGVSTTAPTNDQVLKYNSSSEEWEPGAETDTNTQLTQEQVEDFVNGVIVAGSNVTKTYDDAAGTLTIAASSATLDGIDDQSSSNDDQITIKDTEVVINDDSDDVDFRVEGNGEANLLVCDASGDKVGIGVAVPQARLHVKAASGAESLVIDVEGATENPYMSFRQAGTRRSFIQHHNTGDILNVVSEFGGMALKTGAGGAEVSRVAIDVSGNIDVNAQQTDSDFKIRGDTVENAFVVQGSDGNVGIGTDSPTHKLHIQDSSNAEVRIECETIGTGTAAQARIIAQRDGGACYVASFDDGFTTNGAEIADSGLLSTGTGDAAGLGIRAFASAGDIHFWTGGDNERMRIKSTGNVGIGIDAPTSRLHLYENNSNTDATLGLTIEQDGTGDALLQFLLTQQQRWIMGIDHSDGDKFKIAETTDLGTDDFFAIDTSGNVGIGTTAPGALLDVNQGGGNMIADGYDDHSLAAYKENLDSAPGYLSGIVACPPKEWTRKPYVSAGEIKAAVFEHFSEDVLVAEAVEAKEAVYETVQISAAIEADVEEGIEAQEAVYEEHLVSEALEAKDKVYERQCPQWDAYFPGPDSHRNKAIYNMPEGEMKTWIDNWCEAKRVDMRQELKWQKKRIGLVADDDATAEHLPELIAHDSDGAPTGISTMPYIGMLHSAIIELAAKVEALENK